MIKHGALPAGHRPVSPNCWAYRLPPSLGWTFDDRYTGSCVNGLAFTVLKAKSNPSARSEYYLRGRNHLDGPQRRDSSAGNRLFPAANGHERRQIAATNRGDFAGRTARLSISPFSASTRPIGSNLSFMRHLTENQKIKSRQCLIGPSAKLQP